MKYFCSIKIMLVLLKIILWFVAISYSIILLKDLNRLAKRSLLFRSLFLAGLIAFLIFHYNFFHVVLCHGFMPHISYLTANIITKSPNYQIIKLITSLLLARLPIIFVLWILNANDTKIKSSNNLIGSYLGQQPSLGLRSANKPVVNGISSLKINKTFIWALLFLMFGGNWISHHLLLSISLLSLIYLCKTALSLLRNLKIA